MSLSKGTFISKVRTDVLTDNKIRLDIGCGAHLQKDWVGMDARPFPDYPPKRFIQHDIENSPWPLPDSCASVIQASHIMEHVSPVTYRLHKTFITINDGPTVLKDVELVKTPGGGVVALMNEMWRVLEHEGQAWITGPYGWSHGFVQDPTHTKPLNETLFAYFTPKDWIGKECPLYDIYEPKPWTWIEVPKYSTGGNIIVLLSAYKVGPN